MTEAPDWWAITARVASRRRQRVGESRRGATFHETAAEPRHAVLEDEPAVPEQPPAKELHQMTLEEFRAHCAGVWAQVGDSMDSPAWHDRERVSLSDFLARGQ